MKILIVDDDTNFTALMKLMLESEGFDVVLADNGEIGYSAYLLFEPDLVITDIQMPILTGFELIGLIRGHNPEVKTVYMSADRTLFRCHLKEEQEKYGVSFLEKPFSKIELMDLISQSLSLEEKKLRNSETSEKGDKDQGLKSESNQPNGTKGDRDSEIYGNSPSPFLNTKFKN
jgi:DNA-binding NtrC family response regulator